MGSTEKLHGTPYFKKPVFFFNTQKVDITSKSNVHKVNFPVQTICHIENYRETFSPKHENCVLVYGT